MIESERHFTFVDLRGGNPRREDTHKERPDSEKPYSADSYTAQYGVPQEDVEDALVQYTTHGEVKAWIHREYVSDPEFRERAMYLAVRPFGKIEESERMHHEIDTTGQEDAEEIERRGVPPVKELKDGAW